MNFTPRTERIPASALTQGNPWRPTLVQLLRAVRQKWRVIVLCGMVGAALGVTAKFFVPVEYRTTAQLLFDPRGLRVFNNDLTSGYFDFCVVRLHPDASVDTSFNAAGVTPGVATVAPGSFLCPEERFCTVAETSCCCSETRLRGLSLSASSAASAASATTWSTASAAAEDALRWWWWW